MRTRAIAFVKVPIGWERTRPVDSVLWVRLGRKPTPLQVLEQTGQPRYKPEGSHLRLRLLFPLAGQERAQHEQDFHLHSSTTTQRQRGVDGRQCGQDECSTG